MLIQTSKKSMSEPLYNIEEMQTDGWKEPDQYCHGLTRAQAKEKYEWLVNTESLNPNRLRIQRAQDFLTE